MLLLPLLLLLLVVCGRWRRRRITRQCRRLDTLDAKRRPSHRAVIAACSCGCAFTARARAGMESSPTAGK
eukprot:14948810-Alexandrium_andersonii.AAC.1